jgi:hypothetical protein
MVSAFSFCGSFLYFLRMAPSCGALFGLDAARRGELVLKHRGQDQLDQDREEDDGDAEGPDRLCHGIFIQEGEQALEDGVDGQADHGPPEEPDRVPELANRLEAHGTGSQPPW